MERETAGTAETMEPKTDGREKTVERRTAGRENSLAREACRPAQTVGREAVGRTKAVGCEAARSTQALEPEAVGREKTLEREARRSRVELGADDADDAGFLQPPDPVQGGRWRQADEAGELDIRPVGVRLQGGQQLNVNIIKSNSHTTKLYIARWSRRAILCLMERG